MLPVDMSQALSIVLDTQTLGLDFLALKAFPFFGFIGSHIQSHPQNILGSKEGFIII